MTEKTQINNLKYVDFLEIDEDRLTIDNKMFSMYAIQKKKEDEQEGSELVPDSSESEKEEENVMIKKKLTTNEHLSMVLNSVYLINLFLGGHVTQD